MARNLVCSECGGEMEIGIIVEEGHANWPHDASYWMEGSKEKNWLGRLITDKKKKYYISAFRCKNCGLIKLYADADSPAQI